MIPRLALRLLRLLALGALHATTVQELAQAAWDDGWGRDSDLAERLAKAGRHGQSRGNIARDIMDAVHDANLLAGLTRPYQAQVPGPGGTSNVINVYLPHEQISNALLAHPGGIQDFCLSPAQLARTDGLGPLLHQWGRHRDVGLDPVPPDTLVLGLHADGVTYTTGLRAGGTRSCIVGSVNVVSGQDKAIRGQRHLLFILGKKKLCDCGCAGFHSFNAIFAVLAWSMEILRDGRSPTCRHDGSAWSALDQKFRMPNGVPLPRAALLQVRGDWEWVVLCFRVRAIGSDRFCWMCEATKQDFMDFRQDAPHRGTLLSHEAYIAGLVREHQEPSQIFRCPGFLLDYIAVDSMHAADLGTFQDALGSIFWIEITHKRWYRNSRQGLDSLNAMLKDYYDANQHLKLSPLSLTKSQVRSSDPGYPSLKSKAAQCRHVAAFGLILAQTHKHGSATRPAYEFRAHSRLAGRTAEHLDLLVSMFQGMVAYHDACSAQPFSVDSCKAAMYQYLQSLDGLRRLWRTGLDATAHCGLPFWVRPKAHLLQHLVEEKIVHWGSPMSFWCYGDESFVGSIKKTCTSSSRHPNTLEAVVSEKCMLLAGVDHAYMQFYGGNPEEL